MHVCCGKSVMPNDVVRFVTQVIEVKGGLEEVVAAICLEDGSEQCTISFLSLRLAKFENDKYLNKHGMILEV